MNVRVDKLFTPGLKIPYEYDFGTTSELLIGVLDERKGKALTQYPIHLMGRNTFAPPACHLCDQTAEWICVECQWNVAQFVFCEEHAAQHKHGDMLLPIVNSPRTGLCGYIGPAEPPY